jgi:hypothetical protein
MEKAIQWGQEETFPIMAAPFNGCKQTKSKNNGREAEA